MVLLGVVSVKTRLLRCQTNLKYTIGLLFSEQKKGPEIKFSGPFLWFLFTDYKASETTSLTSGIILCNKLCIPDLSVMVEEGQPLQEPLSSTVTIPST